MQVVVGILQRCEARLLEMTDMEKMVAFLKSEVPHWRHDTLQVCFSISRNQEALHSAPTSDRLLVTDRRPFVKGAPCRRY